MKKEREKKKKKSNENNDGESTTVETDKIDKHEDANDKEVEYGDSRAKNSQKLY